MSEFDEHRQPPGVRNKPPAPTAPVPSAGDTAPATEAAQAGSAAPESGAKTEQGTPTEESIVTVIKTCYDPEIPVDIYELGLIYAVKIDAATNNVKVEMTLTSPNCPAAQSLPAEVEQKVKDAPFVSAASVEVVWEPPWTQDRMSEAAKLALGMY